MLVAYGMDLLILLIISTSFANVSNERISYLFDVLDSMSLGSLHDEVFYRYLGCDATDELIHSIKNELDCNLDGRIDLNDFIK